MGWDPPVHPNHPGTSLDFRVTPAFGGEVVIANDGSKEAGFGVATTIGFTLTPLWIGETIGFGGSAEIGWRVNRINEPSGTLLLSRFPLDVSLHVLAVLSERWYLRFGGGLEYDLGVSVSDSSLAGTDSSFDSSLGGISEFGVCYRISRNFATDINLRFTAIKYSSPQTFIEAKDIGLSVGAHYTF